MAFLHIPHNPVLTLSFNIFLFSEETLGSIDEG